MRKTRKMRKKIRKMFELKIYITYFKHIHCNLFSFLSEVSKVKFYLLINITLINDNIIRWRNHFCFVELPSQTEERNPFFLFYFEIKKEIFYNQR